MEVCYYFDPKKKFVISYAYSYNGVRQWVVVNAPPEFVFLQIAASFLNG